jgi:hypothetical protein
MNKKKKIEKYCSNCFYDEYNPGIKCRRSRNSGLANLESARHHCIKKNMHWWKPKTK